MSTIDRALRISALKTQVTKEGKAFLEKVVSGLSRRYNRYKNKIIEATKKENTDKTPQEIERIVSHDTVLLLETELYFKQRDIYTEYIQYRNLELLKLLVQANGRKSNYNILQTYYNRKSSYRTDLLGEEKITNAMLEYSIFGAKILPYRDLILHHMNGIVQLGKNLKTPQTVDLSANDFVDLYEKNNHYVSDVLDLSTHYETMKHIINAARVEYTKQRKLNPLLADSEIRFSGKVTQFPSNAYRFLKEMRKTNYQNDSNTAILLYLTVEAEDVSKYIQQMDTKSSTKRRPRVPPYQGMPPPQGAPPYKGAPSSYLPTGAMPPYQGMPPYKGAPSSYLPPGAMPPPYHSAPLKSAPRHHALTRKTFVNATAFNPQEKPQEKPQENSHVNRRAILDQVYRTVNANRGEDPSTSDDSSSSSNTEAYVERERMNLDPNMLRLIRKYFNLFYNKEGDLLGSFEKSKNITSSDDNERMRQILKQTDTSIMASNNEYKDVKTVARELHEKIKGTQQ